MDKKIIKSETEEIKEDIKEGINSEEEIKETQQKDLKYGKKIPMKVYRVEENELILVDPHGNGIRIPIPEEHKGVKPGDIIYL